MTVLLTILLFVIMILPHEFGHFIVAKLCGVQVNEFAMGMGPAILQKQKGETLYSLRAVPLGGYCSMEGENEESDNPRAFNNKKAWQKLAVLFAGAAMNVLVANLIMIIAVTSSGITTNYIDSVNENGPASIAGIQAGDHILAIDGNEVKEWPDTVMAINSYKGTGPLSVTVERSGEELTFAVTPEKREDGRVMIGISSRLSHNIFKCSVAGVRDTWNLNRAMLQSFKMLFSGKLSKDDISGPVGIVQLVDESRQYGFSSFLYLAVLISLNLAIINLLPFPALDGGRIIFVIIRKITGNMITDEIEGRVHMIGMVLLIALFIFVTWNDLFRLFK